MLWLARDVRHGPHTQDLPAVMTKSPGLAKQAGWYASVAT
ncbi:hypothetical protein CDS [Bradyrhizobium sp.]|nr:hypothetical protein CDS [Bradyrhizobium sp.]